MKLLVLQMSKRAPQRARPATPSAPGRANRHEVVQGGAFGGDDRDLPPEMEEELDVLGGGSRSTRVTY